MTKRFLHKVSEAYREAHKVPRLWPIPLPYLCHEGELELSHALPRKSLRENLRFELHRHRSNPPIYKDCGTQSLWARPTIRPLQDLPTLQHRSYTHYVVAMQVNGYEIEPGAHLHNANLNNADLSNANLSGADLMHANLRKANLNRANLSNANLSNANLAKAKLSKARLTGANLSKAHLHQANLTNAHLSGANLTGADITGANLTGADLSGAIMPNGKMHKIAHE